VSEPRLCILTETYAPVVGGGEVQAETLATGLRRRGWKVLVVTRRSDRSLPRRESRDGVEVHRLSPSGAGSSRKWALLPSATLALLRLRRSYDVVLVSGFRLLGVSALLSGRLTGRACLLKADSLGEMSGEYFRGGLAKLGLSPSFLPFRAFLALRNRLLRRADRFVAISSVIAEELSAAGIDERAIERIPNCVDTERFRPVSAAERRACRERLGLPLEAPLAVFTGRLVSYKGLPGLLRVWETIRQRHGEARLLLVGAGGMDMHSCEGELREYVASRGLGDRVIFAGEVEEVREYLQASDLFVFPTEDEAFGLSLVEAMSCGLPAVSTNIGGIRDILRHEENGLVVPPGEQEALGRSIDRLISDPSLAGRLGAAARRSAVERFSADRVVRSYARLVEHVLESRRERREVSA
jgi:glycosyltransferase involved in cell wall biosynthesis